MNQLMEKPTELESLASRVLREANALVIVTAEDYELAMGETKAIKGGMNRVIEFFKDAKQKAYAAHAAVCTAESKLLNPLKQGLDIRTSKGRIWKRQQDELVAEQQRQLAAMAKKQAEDRRIEEAAELEDLGDHVQAEERLTAPIEAPAILLANPVPKVVGISDRENWTFEITDESQIPLEYMMPNAQALRQVAKATKGKIKIPGVRIYDAGSTAVRA